MKKSKREGLGTWMRIPSPIVKIEKRNGFVAGVIVQPMRPGSRKLAVLGFEAPIRASEDPLAFFFDNHAHAVVAQDVDTKREARDIADRWLRRWKRNRKPAEELADPCACGEIETPPSAPRKKAA